MCTFVCSLACTVVFSLYLTKPHNILHFLCVSEGQHAVLTMRIVSSEQYAHHLIFVTARTLYMRTEVILQ